VARPYKFAFSYSRWTDWKKCPKMFKYKNIDKIDTGPTPPAMLEGRKVHDDVAKYIEGDTAMPERLAKNFSVLGEKLRWMYKEMKKGIVQVEKQMAFDRDNRPVSWFGQEAHKRFIWDALVVDHDRSTEVSLASAVDWKTGKPYGSYDDQMQIFSIPAFWTYPNLQTFTGHLLYLDTGDDKDFTITREQFYDTVERTWMNNIATMEADVSYAPKPSKDACKWCDFGPWKMNICAEGVK